MAEVAWFTFSGGGALVALGIGTLLVLIRPHSKGARFLLAAIAAFYWIASTWSVSHLAIDALGQRFEPFEATDAPEGRVAVVILGSGSFSARDWDGGLLSVVDTWAAGRVLEAARVFRLVDPAWVISSGGLVRPDDPHESTGLTMQRALVGLGIPADRILSETESRNTASEAAVIRPMLEQLNIDHTILVTSRFHMLRSIGVFRAHGMTVIPAVAREPAPPRGWATHYLPSDRGLYQSALAAHEVLGLGYYRYRGWYR